MDLKELYSIDHLEEAAEKCFSGVGKRTETRNFKRKFYPYLYEIQDDVFSGNWKTETPKKIKVQYPKERYVLDSTLRDRIYQKVLHNYLVYPKISKTFIFDNYASVKGKGPDKACDRVCTLLRRHQYHHGMTGGILHIDIRKFFESIYHAAAEECFARYLEPDETDRVMEVMGKQCNPGSIKGYYPGNEMVQMLGMAILSPLDHYIKEQLHCRCYIRYMDDMLLISKDMEYLKYCLEMIKIELAKLGLEINTKKTRFYDISDRFLFLGYYFQLKESGKVIKTVNPQCTKHYRKKQTRLSALVKDGVRDKETTADVVRQCFIAHAERGDCYQILKNEEVFYETLYMEDDMDLKKSTQTPTEDALQENLISDTEQNRADIAFVAMMSGIDLLELEDMDESRTAEEMV